MGSHDEETGVPGAVLGGGGGGGGGGIGRAVERGRRGGGGAFLVGMEAAFLFFSFVDSV